MAGRQRGEMDPSACHINILLASDLIIIKKPIYTVRHVMLVNCTKKKKNPKACNIKPSNLMPAPLDEPLKYSSFSLPSPLHLSQICLCHNSSSTTFFFILWGIKCIWGVMALGWRWRWRANLRHGLSLVYLGSDAGERSTQEWRSGLSERTYRFFHPEH